MSTDAMLDVRVAWKTGDTCQIFSSSKQKWLTGQIAKIFTDKEGEWLEVRYASKCKQIQRFCKDIRPEPMSNAQRLAVALKRRNTNFRRTAPPFSRKRKLRSSTFTYPATKGEREKRRNRDWVMEDISEGVKTKEVVSDERIDLRRDQNHQMSERKKDIASMTPRQIKDFLRSLGAAYEPYVRTFRRMWGNKLMDLSEDRLQEMVPIKLHRHRLMLEMARCGHEKLSIVASVSGVEVLNWSASEVGVWMTQKLVARQYADLFFNHGVDGLLLFEVDAEDLDTIGVKEIHRKRVLAIISALEKATFPDFTKGAIDNKQKKAENVVAKHKRKTNKVEGDKNFAIEPKQKCSKRLASVSALSAIHSEMDVSSMRPQQVQDMVSSLSCAYERHVRKQHGANESSRAVLCTMGQLLFELGQTFKSGVQDPATLLK